MKSTDNKKAQHLQARGFQLSLFRNNDMATIAQPQYNSNSKPLVIDSFSIRQDEAGRYCINDLHKASGDLRKDRPSYFLENEKTQDLIQAIKDENYDVGNSASYIEPVNIIRGRGKEQGTYVVRELVYSYGMWISAKFHLTVIRAYDALSTNQSLPKTHKSERTPLHDAHALLVAKTKHLNSSDAWKIINQRFGTKSINEIPYDQIPVAVEYVHHLIALYSNTEKKQFSDGDLHNLHALATHMIWAREWWRTFGDAIRTISPTAASLVHSHFVDGYSLAWDYINEAKREELKHYVKDYDWFLPYSERRFIKS